MANILPFRSTPQPRPAAPSPTPCLLPLLLHRIPAGFPSPADEYAESALDLNNTYLVRNKTATFFFRVIGDSMTGANS
jgi:DNA polymerase V